MIQCANCHAPIGDLEKPRYHKDRRVCPACASRLAGGAAAPALLTIVGFVPLIFSALRINDAVASHFPVSTALRLTCLTGLLLTLAGLAWFTVHRLRKS